MDRRLPDGTLVNKDPTRIKRFKFSPEDDAKLESIVKSLPLPINWRLVSQQMETRSPRQCRERYNSFLLKTFDDPEWTNEEDEILNKQFILFGRKWEIISVFLPRHSAISIKKRWRAIQYNYFPNKKSEIKSIASAEIVQPPEDNAEKNESFDKIFDRIFDDIMENFPDDLFQIA